MPGAGLLRHRVTLQRRAEGVDDLGQPVDEWEDVATFWASITDARGREIMESRQATVNEVTTVVRARYREDVLTEMRIREQCHSRRLLDISSVRQVYSPRPETLIECTEVHAEAAA